MKQSAHRQTWHIRDLIIGLLVIAFIISNYIWWQIYQGVAISEQSFNNAIFTHTVQLSQLRNCYEHNTHPCQL